MKLYSSLSWNDIGNEGAKALGNALKVNSTLTEIRQVYVCIRVDGENEIMRWIN